MREDIHVTSELPAQVKGPGTAPTVCQGHENRLNETPRTCPNPQKRNKMVQENILLHDVGERGGASTPLLVSQLPI